MQVFEIHADAALIQLVRTICPLMMEFDFTLRNCFLNWYEEGWIQSTHEKIMNSSIIVA